MIFTAKMCNSSDKREKHPSNLAAAHQGNYRVSRRAPTLSGQPPFFFLNESGRSLHSFFAVACCHASRRVLRFFPCGCMAAEALNSALLFNFCKFKPRDQGSAPSLPGCFWMAGMNRETQSRESLGRTSLPRRAPHDAHARRSKRGINNVLLRIG